MKIIDKDKVKKESLIENLKKEVSILMLVDHPNIVALREVLASNTKIYLVLDYVPGQELFKVLGKKELKIETNGKIDENTSRKYIVQIIRALGHCKSKTIAHRDIKLENIIIDKNQNLKVLDFGLSSLFIDPANINLIMKTTCGTINYIAPEVIEKSGYDGHLADIWATGVVLFCCLAGFLPFEGEKVSDILYTIVQAKVEYPSHFSSSVKDLLNKIFETNPKRRITLDQIIEHPWIKK